VPRADLQVFSSSRLLSIPTALLKQLALALHPNPTMIPTSLFSLALLATAAVAAPSRNSRLSQRVARRRGGLPKKINGPEGSGSTDVTYSSNWAGAVLVADSVSCLYLQICLQAQTNFLPVTGNLYGGDGYIHGPQSHFT
jgi:hypothetical protein